MLKLPRHTKYSYRVIYDHRTLEGIVANAAHDYPNETGGYLLGQPRLLGSGVWWVSGFYSGDKKGATTGSFFFNWEGYLKAVKYAARKNLVVVGMYHSHPWQRSAPQHVSIHSESDAHVQDAYDHALSLVIGVTPESWSMLTWKNGYNARVKAKIGAGTKEHTIAAYQRKHPDHPVWGSLTS